MSQQTAKTLVNQFLANNAAQGQWPNIDKAALAAGLIARIDNPNAIDQGSTPFCGPTTLVRSLAVSNPDAYAQAAIDLYLTKRARVGTLDVRPGNELVQASVAARTNPADWIMLASIRDTDNWFLSPAGWFGSNLAGITIPSTIENWFRAAGYTRIINDTDVSGGDIPVVKSMRAMRASRCFSNGYNVNMLIDADLLDSSTQNDWVSMYPDHWVVLRSTILNAGTTNYDSPCSFQVFTWGNIRPVPFDPSKPLKHEYFLNKFYGFVAAKH
jgi:hypothetical protein